MSTFTLLELPYAADALSPFISAETIQYHYGKHHQTYIDNLNKLIANTEFIDKSLVTIVKNSAGTTFNNAAQVWNHDFYWECLTPKVNTLLPIALAERIKLSFGSLEQFKSEFTKAALTLFGSGWTWLVEDTKHNLTIVNTVNAANPLTLDQNPLLVCDLWEHAYYIDYRNARAKYLESFWQVVNWEFVARQLRF